MIFNGRKFWHYLFCLVGTKTNVYVFHDLIENRSEFSYNAIIDLSLIDLEVQAQ